MSMSNQDQSNPTGEGPCDLVGDPLALESEQHHAFSERVAWHTVLLVNSVRSEATSANGQVLSSEVVGVGTACSWKGKDLILTARHVLDGAGPPDLRFFLRPTGVISWNTRPSQVPVSQTTLLKVEGLARCQFEDLACVILGKNDYSGRLEFTELPAAFDEVPPSGGGTLIFGSPTDQALVVAEGLQTGGIPLARFGNAAERLLGRSRRRDTEVFPVFIRPQEAFSAAL